MVYDAVLRRIPSLFVGHAHMRLADAVISVLWYNFRHNEAWFSSPTVYTMPPNTEFVGPIAKSRKKADLIDIANGLGIESAGTIPVLVSCIQEYLKNHQELAADPKFQKLFMYQPGAAERKQAESKMTGKNSADKGAEDAVEAVKPSAPATG